MAFMKNNFCLSCIPFSPILRDVYCVLQAIVFVVGGGNYIEYQNLMDHIRNKSGGGGVSGVAGSMTGSMTATLKGNSSGNSLSSLGVGSSSSSPRKNIIYGCTDLMNADQFLAQLSLLGDQL